MENAEDLDIVMPIHNFLECCDNYSVTLLLLYQIMQTMA